MHQIWFALTDVAVTSSTVMNLLVGVVQVHLQVVHDVGYSQSRGARDPCCAVHQHRGPRRHGCIWIHTHTQFWMCYCPHGVPQGFILGPFLFIIYKTDMGLNVSDAILHLYADDTLFTLLINSCSGNWFFAESFGYHTELCYNWSLFLMQLRLNSCCFLNPEINCKQPLSGHLGGKWNRSGSLTLLHQIYELKLRSVWIIVRMQSQHYCFPVHSYFHVCWTLTTLTCF